MSIEHNFGPRMSNADAVVLCRFTKACCPAQQIDQYTPDAWFELLSDLRFEDCKAAVVEVAKTRPFVAPAEIRAEVKRKRNKRIGDFGPLPEPPVGLPPREYAEWHALTVRKIADGDVRPGEVVTPPQVQGAAPVAELPQAGTTVRSALSDSIAKVRAAQAEARRELQAARKPEPEPLLGPDDHTRESVAQDDTDDSTDEQEAS